MPTQTVASLRLQGAAHSEHASVFSTRQQSQVLSSSLESLEKREEVLQDKLGSLENQHLQDASRLKSQLDQAQARTVTLQKEVLAQTCFLLLSRSRQNVESTRLFVSRQCEDTQLQLLDLHQRYQRTEQEKLNIHQELEQCRSSLKLLQDKTSSVSPQQKQNKKPNQAALSLIQTLNQVKFWTWSWTLTLFFHCLSQTSV